MQALFLLYYVLLHIMTKPVPMRMALNIICIGLETFVWV